MKFESWCLDTVTSSITFDYEDNINANHFG
jgi:hypothetical protein